MAGIQSIQPAARNRCFHRLMVGAVVRSFSLNGAVGIPLGQHQDQPGTEHIPGGQRTGLNNTAEFHLLTAGENDRLAGHTCLDATNFSNVYSATVH
jgi:hypothetical protein